MTDLRTKSYDRLWAVLWQSYDIYETKSVRNGTAGSVCNKTKKSVTIYSTQTVTIAMVTSRLWQIFMIIKDNFC